MTWLNLELHRSNVHIVEKFESGGVGDFRKLGGDKRGGWTSVGGGGGGGASGLFHPKKTISVENKKNIKIK